MKENHTPAPWRLTYSNCWVVGNDAQKGEIVIAKMEAGTLADARLMAAAPNLLSALEGIMKWWTETPSYADGEDEMPVDLFVNAISAISKSTRP